MKNVLIVEDDQNLREAIVDMLELNDISCDDVENGQAAELYLSNNNVSLVLSDVQMSPVNGYELLESINKKYPGLPVILMTAYGSIPQAVDAIQAGAVDYLVKPFEVSDLVNTIQKQMNPIIDCQQDLIALDPISRDTMQLASRVASSEATVLLNGESGVGKEVYSKFIHNQSTRNNGPFIAINCAAIPENMLEAVLFGYEKGAFTGAVKAAPGKFEQAQGGTLLLDEISEMDLSLQAKLLRVIQERQVERLGSSKIIDLDVRLIATTNRDLKQQVVDKKFREDLYYRLNVFPILIQPLRHRRADILPIAEKLLSTYHQAAGGSIGFSDAAKNMLLDNDWPGNVRELDNVIQRALILQQGQVIEAADIMLEPPQGITADHQEADSGRLQADLRDRETEVIIETLNGYKGSRKKTAEKLGISPRTLRYKLAKLRETGVAIPE